MCPVCQYAPTTIVDPSVQYTWYAIFRLTQDKAPSPDSERRSYNFSCNITIVSLQVISNNTYLKTSHQLQD